MLELALTTFDRELYEQGLREEGEKIGEARGKELGEIKGEDNLSKLITILMDAGLDDAIRVVISDKATREEYYKKYNIK